MPHQSHEKVSILKLNVNAVWTDITNMCIKHNLIVI